MLTLTENAATAVKNITAQIPADSTVARALGAEPLDAVRG